MTSSLILILLLIGMTFKNRVKENYRSESFFIKNNRLLVILAASVLSIIIVNSVYTKPRELKGQDKIDFIIEKGSRNEKELIYLELTQEYPDSVALHFKYIDLMLENSSTTCGNIDLIEFSPNKNVQNLSKHYAYSQCRFQVYSNKYNAIHLDTSPGIPYVNFVQGVREEQKMNFEKAKKLFLAEIDLNPDFEESYYKLLRLNEKHFSNDLKSFVLNDKYGSHLPLSIRHKYYFKYGKVLPYLKAITIRTFSDIQPFAFIAALIISIVWLVFLRSMDVYNKERWIDIFIVFAGGTLFANLCFPIYDYFHYVLNFQINGNPINDFWYCTIVIGGAEEIVKLIPWVLFALLSKKLKEPYDFMLYASASALGFAFIENWMYLENPGNIVGRSIMSTTSHMFNASLIGYSVILSRYKAKKLFWKISFPVIGLILACLAHGFYDFWLISPIFNDFMIMTVIFLVLSIHIWFYLCNNAINNSGFHKKNLFNSEVQLNLLSFGIIGILLVEYLIMGVQFGAQAANRKIATDSWMVFIFIAYMTMILSNFKIEPGKWKRYSLPLSKVVNQVLALPSGSFPQATTEHIFNTELSISLHESNRYVSHLFPLRGSCIKNITISGEYDWIIFKPASAIEYPDHRNDYLLIRLKEPRASLGNQNVEIILLFIPVGIEIEDPFLHIKEFTYTGKAYAKTV